MQKAIPCPQPRPRRAPIPTNRFFDDVSPYDMLVSTTSHYFLTQFDPRSPPGRSNRAASTTRNADSSQIKNIINRFFSRSSATQGHPHCPRRIPLVEVAATRGKYVGFFLTFRHPSRSTDIALQRTANRHSGKRHKLAQLQRPPRRQAHAGASSSSTPPAGTSNAIGKAIPAMLHAGSTSATNRLPSSLNVEHVPDISCFALLARCFPCLRRTSSTTPHTG
jgi:hypothetical protein